MLANALLAAVLTFVHVSDPQLGWYADPKCEREKAYIAMAVERINALRPDFVVITGDLVDALPGSRKRLWQVPAFREAFKSLQVSVYLVPGNHDVGQVPTPQSLYAYRENFGSDLYVKNIKGARLLFLNSTLLIYPQKAKQEHKNYINQLKAVIQTHKTFDLVFMHHPLYWKHPNESFGYFNFPKDKREYALKQLEPLSVRAIFTGHKHVPMVVRHNDTMMVNAPSLTAPRENSKAGYNVVTYDTQKRTVNVVEVRF